MIMSLIRKTKATKLVETKTQHKSKMKKNVSTAITARNKYIDREWVVRMKFRYI